MFKSISKNKNCYNSCELIQNGMLKRRRLACAAILNLSDTRQMLRVVK